MNKQIKSAVRKYVKYVKKADYISAEQFAKELGYTVILYNTTYGNEILEQCECVAFAKKHRAFTHFGLSNTIFIDGDMSTEDRYYLLLHEIGHILLGHIGDGKRYARNSILIDIEANTFVNAVLEYRKINIFSLFHVALILIVGIMLGFTITYCENIYSHNFLSNSISTNQTDIVYITLTGTKYHRADCMYTKENDCTAVSKAEAAQTHKPCKFCNP